MKVSKQLAKKTGKLTQKSAKSLGKKENKNVKAKNQKKSTINAAKPANKLKDTTNQKHQSAVQLSKKSKAKNYSEEIISKKDSFVQVKSVKDDPKQKTDSKKKTAQKHPAQQKGKKKLNKVSVKTLNAKQGGHPKTADKKTDGTHAAKQTKPVPNSDKT